MANRSIETTFVPSYVHEHDDIRLYSYGVHIGSVPLGIPESLVLGGYDKNRVLGDVSTQSYSSGDLPIDLLDLKIGVVSGDSPWTVTVFASGANPYIYLPHITCEDIAAELPITDHPEYGLYFWNTEAKRYSDIVSAPTYLGFTFSKNGLNNAYITINVPFSLLNLTLEAPLAVFVGVNWGPHQGSWFLAYAPGRNIPGTTTVVTINPSDSTKQEQRIFYGSRNQYCRRSSSSSNLRDLLHCLAVAAGRRQPTLVAVQRKGRDQEQPKRVYEMDNSERSQVYELS
ncbi:hypothetical protein BDV36DRAFT_290947 [Aspergillus pseudocaelatus]|uniref:Peptidase A1 domain-containing protein n=1 Tax=Aspergillus pseudocaelatus TaxID=1825620 RepID=A0ABQ6X3R4_9EURO|nr:hypothetical protein BDV36DRAFT_290947 [Aspergillus pseudocaelatus]